MRLASFLSLSNQKTAFPTAVTAPRVTNVPLPTLRGKLTHYFYNPLKVKEFRVDHRICRLVRRAPHVEQPPQFPQRIRPREKRTAGPLSPQPLQRGLGTYSKVYEASRGPEEAYGLSLSDPAPAGGQDHVPRLG